MNFTSDILKLREYKCLLYRFFTCLLFVFSIINLFVIFRYFIKRYYSQQKYFIFNRLFPIMTGMSVSSLLLIFVAAPPIFIQSYDCQPILNNIFLCKIHALVCFSNGLFNMYIVALLSCLRYLSLLHQFSLFDRFFKYHGNLSVIFCALIAVCWSIPSLFDIGNKYIPKTGGFYCSLRWNDPHLSSRIFVFSMIFFNYILPFFLVIYTNLRVWYTLRSLLKSQRHFTYMSLPLPTTLSIRTRRFFTDFQLEETRNRLQRLKIDQRYACITAILALQYLIIWTPYACVVILEFLDRSDLLGRNSILPILSALFAKISLLLNPVIFLYTSTMTRK